MRLFFTSGEVGLIVVLFVMIRNDHVKNNVVQFRAISTNLSCRRNYFQFVYITLSWGQKRLRVCLYIYTLSWGRNYFELGRNDWGRND